jgi:hypothetical protein
MRISPLVCLPVLLLAAGAVMAETPWKAGVAKAVVTPGEPVWLAGFGFRTHPSEGVRQDIYTRALVLEDAAGRTSVIVTLDLAALDREMAEEIAGRLKTRYGTARERLLINISHTHSGPVSGLKPMPLYDLTPEQRAAVDRFTANLMAKTVDAVGAAMANRQPATLRFEQGLAAIGVNRRRVTRRALPATVDPDVPVLAVRNAAGALVAVVAGYACHATALNDYRISNDWPGFALVAIEKAHPGATALFIQGCGADVNALPRGGEELARNHGEMLAAAVGQVLKAKMRPVNGPIAAALERVDLPMRNLFTRAELEQRLKNPVAMYRTTARKLLAELDREGKFPESYPLPVQVWRFGKDLKLVALGGEVVVDYALRLKAQHGFENTWVAGYSNDLPGYIPSRRVLEEGGYEGGDALVLFGRPGRWGAAVEELIVEKVKDLMEATGRE